MGTPGTIGCSHADTGEPPGRAASAARANYLQTGVLAHPGGLLDRLHGNPD